MLVYWLVADTYFTERRMEVNKDLLCREVLLFLFICPFQNFRCYLFQQAKLHWGKTNDQCKSSFLQTLLQNNASAAFLNSQLSETEWRVEDVSSFLSKFSEDKRPVGSAYTWRDVFNETDQAIQTISRFMEVSILKRDAATLSPIT